MTATMLGSDDGDKDPRHRRAHVRTPAPDWDALAAMSSRRTTRRAFVLGSLLSVLILFISSALVFAFSDEEEKKRATPQLKPIDATPFLWVLSVAVILLIATGVAFLITRRQYMKNQNEGFTAKLKAQADYHREAIEKLRKTTELATLMELNQDQISRYHRIVTEQADKAFKSSRMAMGIGLFLLVVAACGGAYVPLEEIRWFIAALAAFSTLLSGFISKTYMMLYRDSIGQLNRYFDQPVLNSYYLTAERLTAGLDIQHAQVIRQQIINEVLATSSRMGAKEAGQKVSPALQAVKLKKKPKKEVPKRSKPPTGGQTP